MAKILRGDGVSFPASSQVENTSTIDIYDDLGNIIGFITSLNETLNRQVQRVRQLSSESAGRVIEIIPFTEDISLSVAGYSLYDKSQARKGSLIHRMGSHMGAMKSLQSQSEPFHIVKVSTHPVTGDTIKDWYFDCWIVSFTRSRDIGRLITVDQASIQCGQKE